MDESDPMTDWGVDWVELTIGQLTELPRMSRREAIARIRMKLDGDGFGELRGTQRSVAIAYLDGLIRGSQS